MSSSSRSCGPTLFMLVVVVFMTALYARGQELEISVSPTPVGSGARAAGMAGAFVAIADDATAASWNPAGLVQLERPELAIVGSWNGVREKFFAHYHDEVDSTHFTDNLELNYLSIVYPIPVLIAKRNAVVSLSYQRKFNFDRSFDLRFNTGGAVAGTPLNNFLSLDFEQTGGLAAISPAFAYELTQRLSIGVTVNFWRSTFLSKNSWEQKTRTRTVSIFGIMPSVTTTRTDERYDDFSGENFTVGVLWNPIDPLRIGLRYDTAFTGEAKYKRTGSRVAVTAPSPFLPMGFLSVIPSYASHTRHIRLPDSLALGISYRVNDRLTLAIDATRTGWNDFYVKDNNGLRRSLVNAGSLDDFFSRPSFDPTYTVRLGVEYVFLPKEPEENLGTLWTVRGGLFFDQEPATGQRSGFRSPFDNGSGDPDDFYGFAVGFGVQPHRRINLDWAYQLRYGNNVNRDFIRGISGFREDVIQHRVILSSVIYF